MWEYSKRLIAKIESLLHSSDFARFFISGSVAFASDWITLQFLIRVMGFNPQVFGVFSGANLISSTVGMIISFYLNRNWSFRAGTGSISRQGVKFLVVQAFSWFLNNLLFGIATFQLGLDVTVAKVGVTLLQMIWVYFLYKWFVFAR